jgi:hypothetical protein
MKFKLLEAGFGLGLYKEGELVATWDNKEPEGYIVKQLAVIMGPGDLLVDEKFDGVSFPASLPKPKPAPKPKVAKSKTLD